ncbi:IS30 family transposase [Ornithobacterium rhinotracheale]|uniref:IS30 family transposase n=1 Tax=Ornithobacterium rhinotracheale TaxID=28251 RepID=A0A3R5XU89_ORNRH|nr:IS30 family transposase [Ornithobacterium rhinotracheale]QAR30597.1 IS30 family transposase [Ornithobacterium rhinotracheale]
MARRFKHLDLHDRAMIEAYLKAGWSISKIARELKRDKSTISREVRRNRTKKGKYKAKTAQTLYSEKKERFLRYRRFTKDIEKRVKQFLYKRYSPLQIVGYCKSLGLEMVSVERIYQYIRLDKLKGGDLWRYCRHSLKRRKVRVSKVVGKIRNRVSIEERPQVVNDRMEFGHWEGDLIEGKNHKGYLLTITERVSRFLFIRYIPNKSADVVANAMNDVLLPYKKVVKSITVDNGLEFANHENVAKKLQAQIYFTDPYSSWQKGQIEHMNKLIRQYVKKGSAITKSTANKLKAVQKEINDRPFKVLKFSRPREVFFNFVENVAFRG